MKAVARKKFVDKYTGETYEAGSKLDITPERYAEIRKTDADLVIAEKMLLYNKAAGKVLEGLTKRRQAERELFLSGGSAKGAGAEKSTVRNTLKKGSRGADVTYLQQRLTAKGYGVGAKTWAALQ